RGGQPAARGADLDRGEGELAELGQRPRAPGPGDAGSLLDRCRRRRPHPFDHDVPGSAAASRREVPAPLPRGRPSGDTDTRAGARRPHVRTERGDTVTENALLAAALDEGETVIRNASPNYMVQDLCFFLEKLGVSIDGIGTTTLRVQGRARISTDVDYAPSEDPIEAMSL